MTIVEFLVKTPMLFFLFALALAFFLYQLRRYNEQSRGL